MNKHSEPLFHKSNFSRPGMINFSNIFITPQKHFNLSVGVAGKEMLTLSALSRSCQFLLSDRTTKSQRKSQPKSQRKSQPKSQRKSQPKSQRKWQPK